MDMKPDYPDAPYGTFESGMAFQDYVADIFWTELEIEINYYNTMDAQYNIGESRQGIEVKEDKRILETGNVSIEVAERSSVSVSVWTPSGIMREDNTWLYVQGNTDIIFVFAKKWLRLAYEKRYKEDEWMPLPTIRAFRMKIKDAEIMALKTFRF